jgi:hypothetical protein
MGDATSELAAAEAARESAKSKADADEAEVQTAETSLAPVAKRAEAADDAVSRAEEEVGTIEEELVVERKAAADAVTSAEESYDDEKSSHDALTTSGLVVALAALVAAAAAFAFSRFRKWPLSTLLTQVLGVVAGFVFVGGLLLALLPSEPSTPKISAHTRELAVAAEGDPADPPSDELRTAEEAVVPLAAQARPLDRERSVFEGKVETASSKSEQAEVVLASATRTVRAAKEEVDRIEAVAHEESEFREDATTIDYGELIKNPQAHVGEKVVYTGQIFQIQEYGGFGFMLLSVTDEGYGFWTDEIWVDFEGPIEATEEDVITVYGKLTGSEEYETQIGGSRYVPKMRAKYIDE